MGTWILRSYEAAKHGEMTISRLETHRGYSSRFHEHAFSMAENYQE